MHSFLLVFLKKIIKKKELICHYVAASLQFRSENFNVGHSFFISEGLSLNCDATTLWHDLQEEQTKLHK